MRYSHHPQRQAGRGRGSGFDLQTRTCSGRLAAARGGAANVTSRRRRRLLSRHDVRRRAAGAAAGSRDRSSGDQLQASSLRPPGEEERVVWSRQFPTSRGPLGVRVRSCPAEPGKRDVHGKDGLAPCVRVRAPTGRLFSRALLFSSWAGRGRCPGETRGIFFSRPERSSQLLAGPEAAGGGLVGCGFVSARAWQA